MDEFNLITVTGPTASGKTSFAVHLAQKINGEIISADSRQVYRQMDLGTGKDLTDYKLGKTSIPYHLIDIHNPGYHYNVYEFQKDFFRVYHEVIHRSKVPILAGGTGMYIESILNQYQLVKVPVNEALRQDLESLNQNELVKILKETNPELHNSTDTQHRKRTIRAIEIAKYCQRYPQEKHPLPEIHSLIFGVRYDRKSQRKKISERLLLRLDQGLVEEVQALLKILPPENLIYYGLEYKFITMYLTGAFTYADMFSKLETAIHQFAKRQMTWFRKMERSGYRIHWLDGHMPMDEKLTRAKLIMERYRYKYQNLVI